MSVFICLKLLRCTFLCRDWRRALTDRAGRLSRGRFIQTSDNSLTITKTTELDSKRYTCVASTDLDSAEANATLKVEDVPNAPILKHVTCR